MTTIMRKIVQIDREKCNGCGNCIIDCHEAAIRLVNGKAEVIKDSLCDGLGDCLGNCPMDAITIIEREAAPYDEEEVKLRQNQVKQWPLKIRLVSPDAELFKGADLVIAADCAAFADPAFHKNYMKGSPVIIGCPKFDDTGIYAERIEQIFARAGLSSCTVLRMEVPCCGGLARIAEAAAEKYGVKLNVEIMEISR